MLNRLPIILLLLVISSAFHSPAAADDRTAGPKIQEEIWALPFPLPVLAYLVRPAGDGPFPLVIMNHGISLDANQRTMFPMIEYRDAAYWFARRGYVVISPIRYGASSLDDKDQGLYGAVFAHVGSCDNPNFRGPGLAIATLNEWVIDYMSKKKMIEPGKVVVVGQSGGGWGSIALEARTRHQFRPSLPLQRAVEAELMANPTTIVLPTSSLPLPANLAAPHAYRCFGFTRKTIPTSDRH